MIRLGIAGCGRIVERGYLPAALAAESVNVVAFADPNGERLADCLGLWREGGGEANGFADLTGLLAAEEIDLLIVAAPLDRHVALAEEAAAAGVRSLIEKPPAPDLAGARCLTALDPEPFLAFNRRFLQGAELHDSIPAEGWLEIDLELRFKQGAWGAHEVRDEALLDAGIHLIDLACHLGAAAPIAVRGARISPQRASLELELGRGRARIECATDRSHRESVTVRDRAGKVVARSAWGGLGARLAGLTGRPDPLAVSLRRQLEALRDSAFVHSPSIPGKGRTPRAGGADGVNAMAVVEAARRSAALDGAEVTVEPAEAPA